MIEYPSNLPAPLIRDYSYQDNTKFVRDDPAIGPLVSSLESVQNYTVYDVSFSLSETEIPAFRYFIETTLVDRSKSFAIELKYDGQFINAVCYISNVGYSSVGKRWNVSCQLISVDELLEETPIVTPITTASHYWDMDASATQQLDSGTSSTDYNLSFIGNLTPTQPSLRSDATGFSILFPQEVSNGDSYLQNLVFQNTFLSHFTIEGIFKFDTIQDSGGNKSQIGITTPEEALNGGIFNLTADNLNDTVSSSTFPTFTLQLGGVYVDGNDYNNLVVADARSSVPVILGNTYHLLGTFNAITKTLYLYVNGVLAGTDTITDSDYDNWLGSGEDYLGDSGRLNRRTLRLGKRPVGDIATNADQSGRIDNVLLHNGIFMNAGQAAQQATIAGYTP
jgi:hypothetical protein